MIEEWRKVKGYEKYSVSNKGNVRNDETGRILKKSVNNNGYELVSLGKNSGKLRVHRLVASAFLGDVKGFVIDHIDGNKQNNNVENLEIVTSSENNKRAYDCGLKKAKKLVNAKSKTVYAYNERKELVGTFKSMKDASNVLGVRDCRISDVCRRKRKSYKGYVFTFEKGVV